MDIALNQSELTSLFRELKTLRFAVIGDFCQDIYYFLDNSSSEISIETGLATETVKTHRFTPGGAGNVAANLTAMGARHVYGFGVVGDDPFGREYLHLLSSYGINTDGFVVQSKDWHTNVYTKLYDGQDERPRIDIGNFNRLTDASANQLLNNFSGIMPDVDIVLINQQLVNGIHIPEFRERLQAVIRDNPDRTFLLDSRDYTDLYSGTIRKLNDIEAARAAGIDREDTDCRHVDVVSRAADILYRRWGLPVFITRGDRGSLAFDGRNMETVPALHLLSKLDTVGAGDSIFAGLAAGLAAGLSNSKALFFATYVAGVTIQKRFQTGTAGEEEIRAMASSAEYRLHPEKAETIRSAKYLTDSEIEVVSETPPGPISFAVFDHDGTISTLREGWESVMEPMMIRAIMGDAYHSAGENVVARVTEDVRDMISKTTGVQTVLQMVELIKLIRHWGFVAESDILDPLGYKNVYLETLNRTVQKRLDKITRRETDVSDVTVKGAVRFLHMLKGKGVTLYLASGSDETDVRREASFLGYAGLFDGGIYGAEGAITEEPKKVALEKIMAQIGTGRDGRVAAFGDGPVELRETFKVGGYRVGVASDEIRRFGLNPAKRPRLILAGADLVIPDFSQGERLLYLFFH